MSEDSGDDEGVIQIGLIGLLVAAAFLAGLCVAVRHWNVGSPEWRRLVCYESVECA